MHVSLDSALGRQRRLNSVGESVLQIAPNAAAAYSLRSLTGGDPKVVRVRRGSDNHEQDFTASEVSSGALTSFVNAQVVAPLDIQALSATGRDGDFLIAKAAYSLRSLGTRQATLAATGDTVARADGKFVVQVRRSSDDALKSFTADEVTDGTLLAFVNEDVELFSNDFETNTSGFTLNTGGSNVAVRNTSDGFSGSGCLQLNLTSSSNSISTVKTDTYMQDTDGVTYTVSFYAKAISGSANLVVKIGTESSSLQQISFSENGGEWVKHSLTFVNNFGAGAGNRNQRILFAGSTNNTTEWRIDDFKIVQTTSNAFVKTWYDQSVTNQAGDTATGNHAVQATAANQPKIVNAGALVADNGIDLDGSQFLQADSVSGMGATVSMITASVHDSGGGGCVSLASSASGTTNFGIIEGNSVTNVNSRNTTSVTASASVSGATRLSFALTTGQTLTKSGALGGTLVESTSDYGDDFTSGELDRILIGKLRASSGTLFNGRIREALIYDTDQTDNRTAIEANIGEAYSIDLPSGVDPGFDQVDGFVETWYDQSGNSNDAVQATAGSQPKIVNAGSFLNELDFDGTADELTIDFGADLSQANSFFMVHQSDTTTANSNDFFDRVSGSPRTLFDQSGNNYRMFSDSSADTGVAITTDKSLVFALYNGSSSLFAKNGTATSALNAGTAGVNQNSSLGASNVSFYDGTMQEFIIYNSDQSSNRVAVETNINNQYSIF